MHNPFHQRPTYTPRHWGRSVSVSGDCSPLHSASQQFHETFLVRGEDDSNVGVVVIPTQNDRLTHQIIEHCSIHLFKYHGSSEQKLSFSVLLTPKLVET